MTCERGWINCCGTQLTAQCSREGLSRLIICMYKNVCEIAPRARVASSTFAHNAIEQGCDRTHVHTWRSSIEWRDRRGRGPRQVPHVGAVAAYLGPARAHVGVTARPRSCLADVPRARACPRGRDRAPTSMSGAVPSRGEFTELAESVGFGDRPRGGRCDEPWRALPELCMRGSPTWWPLRRTWGPRAPTWA